MEKIDAKTIEAVCDGVAALMNMTKVEISKAYLRANKGFTIGFKATFTPAANPEETKVKVDIDFVPEKVHESVVREASETMDMIPGTKEAVEKDREARKGKPGKGKKEDPMLEKPHEEIPRKCGRKDSEVTCPITVCMTSSENCVDGQVVENGEPVFTTAAGPSDDVGKQEEGEGVGQEKLEGKSAEEGHAEPGDVSKETETRPEIPGLEKPADSPKGKKGKKGQEQLSLGEKTSQEPEKPPTPAEPCKVNDAGILQGTEVLAIEGMPKGVECVVNLGLAPDNAWRSSIHLNINIGDCKRGIGFMPSLKGTQFENREGAIISSLEKAKDDLRETMGQKIPSKTITVLNKAVGVIDGEIEKYQSIMMFNMENEADGIDPESL